MTSKTSSYSQNQILEIIRQIDRENFILANALRMVYFAGFHKNEIEKIKIGNVQKNRVYLSRIEPFLEPSRKAYTSLPIILDSWPRKILVDHICQLERAGYPIEDEATLFPDPRTKGNYSAKNLQRHFNRKFGSISFDDLRKFGIEREQRRLKAKYGDTEQYRDRLSNYARHSRGSTTRQLINGQVQKAGKKGRKDLPWEIVVKEIEELPFLKKDQRSDCASNIAESIGNAIVEEDIKKSLYSLLDHYKWLLDRK